MKMDAEVLIEIEHAVMTATINRPKTRNAVNRRAAELLAAAMEELDSNPAIRVAIITGANNTFCSGMDLKAFVRGELPEVKGRGFAGLCEAPPKKPLIAAVEGYALAGGFEIALVSDLIVAADNARFGIPECKRGLVAAAGGMLRLPRQIPSRIAMELALTGDFIDAQRAYQIGLINRVVPEGTALEAAKHLARTIAANGPMAVAVSKQVIIESQDWATTDMFRIQKELIRPIFQSRDAIEGASAFAEKRVPNWKNQ
jgi:enoyl-CoA hydratase